MSGLQLATHCVNAFLCSFMRLAMEGLYGAFFGFLSLTGTAASAAFSSAFVRCSIAVFGSVTGHVVSGMHVVFPDTGLYLSWFTCTSFFFVD